MISLKFNITKVMILIGFTFTGIFSLSAQVEYPGAKIVGYGYDVFGEYANNRSVKDQQIFRMENFTPDSGGNIKFDVPSVLKVSFLDDKTYTHTEGRSLREYAKGLSAGAGLSYDGLLFSASIESRFTKNSKSMSTNYFKTITDINTMWYVKIDDLILKNPRPYLTDTARVAIDTWAPEELFSIFGSHFLASAYLGGAMDFNLSQSFTNETEAQSISTSVDAAYGRISAKADIEVKKSSVNENFVKNVKIYARGGNAQFVNSSSTSDNGQYNLWVKTIPEKSVLIDFEYNDKTGYKSLQPIWSLAATESRKKELESAFIKMIAKYPLPKEMANMASIQSSSYMIRQKKSGTYWDFSGYNIKAETKFGELLLAPKDGKDKGQGFDRIFKILSLDENNPQLVYFQPQHADLVLAINGGSKEVGSPFYLNNYAANHQSQKFILEPVDGEQNTYFIKVNYTNLYLEGNGSKVSQQSLTGNDNQKWILEIFNPSDIAIPNSAFYAVQSAAVNKYWDFAGAYPKISGTTLISNTLGTQEGDRVYRIVRLPDTDRYLIRPGHEDSRVLTARSNGEQLFVFDQTRSDNQLFTFAYGGGINTYVISHVGTGSVIDLREDRMQGKNAPISLQKLIPGALNQQWILNFHKN